jgi:hypothetical protein
MNFGYWQLDCISAYRRYIDYYHNPELIYIEKGGMKAIL